MYRMVQLQTILSGTDIVDRTIAKYSFPCPDLLYSHASLSLALDTLCGHEPPIIRAIIALFSTSRGVFTKVGGCAPRGMARKHGLVGRILLVCLNNRHIVPLPLQEPVDNTSSATFPRVTRTHVGRLGRLKRHHGIPAVRAICWTPCLVNPVPRRLR